MLEYVYNLEDFMWGYRTQLQSCLLQQKLPANFGHGFADFCHLNVIGGFHGNSQDLPAFVFTSPHPE
jgi:hypothetical protein